MSKSINTHWSLITLMSLSCFHSLSCSHSLALSIVKDDDRRQQAACVWFWGRSIIAMAAVAMAAARIKRGS
ncbi:hypothetical protein GBA52_016095 [Prunus armeniaca]|nr:hypothetical protein GBA52_016095 [Prunus armeniaca]